MKIMTSKFGLMVFSAFVLSQAIPQKTAVAAEESDSAKQSAQKKLTSKRTGKSYQETSLLKAEAGDKGDRLGASVDSVSETDGELILISVIVPRTPELGQNIELVGAKGKKLEQSRIAQVINDYENNNVGIKFYSPKRKSWAFKVRFYDDSNEK